MQVPGFDDKVIVLTLANGNWSDASKITHCCTNCCRSKEDCCQKLDGLLVGALAGTNPPVWNDSRWLGAEAAIGWIGALQSVHNLLGNAFQEIARTKLPAGLADRGSGVMSLKAMHQTEERRDAGKKDENHGVGGAHDVYGGRQGDPEVLDSGDVEPSIAWEIKRQAQSKYMFSAGSWLALYPEDSLGIFVVIAKVLGPLAKIMQCHLEAAGESWETAQISCETVSSRMESNGSRAGRDAHVFLALDNEFEREALAQVRDMMSNSKLWCCLPTPCFNRTFQNKAFTCLSAMGCLIHHVTVSHQGYPWKLFGLLRPDADPSLQDEILNDCPETLDTWSKWLVNLFKGKDLGLADPDLAAILRVTSLAARRETAQIECRHAAIRRALVATSVQTHRAQLIHVSAGRSCQDFRKWCRRRDLNTKSSDQSSRRTNDPCLRAPKAKSHGGAWRAYIRQETLGTKQSPDLRELAVKYRALTPDMRMHYASLVAKGKLARGLGAKYMFGPTTRQAAAHERKRQLDLAVESLAANPPPPKRRACTDLAALSTSGVLSGGDDSGSLEVVGSTLQALVGFQRSLRLEREAERLRARRVQEQLYDHWKDGGRKSLVELSRKIKARSLEIRADEFINTHGAEDFHAFQWIPCDVVHRVKRALGVHARGHQAQLLKTLESFWANLHQTIDCTPEEQPAAKKDPVSPCSEAGFCLCNDLGSLIKRFVVRLDAFVKRACPFQSDARGELALGQRVLLLLGQAKPDEEEDVGNATEDVLLDTPIVAIVWLHVGHHLLSPWKASFHVLSGLEVQHDVDLPTEVDLLATFSFQNRYQAVKGFDFNLRWCGCLYEVADRPRAVHTFCPGSVMAGRLLDTFGMVWCPWLKASRKMGAKRVAGGWAAVAQNEERAALGASGSGKHDGPDGGDGLVDSPRLDDGLVGDSGDIAAGEDAEDGLALEEDTPLGTDDGDLEADLPGDAEPLVEVHDGDDGEADALVDDLVIGAAVAEAGAEAAADALADVLAEMDGAAPGDEPMLPAPPPVMDAIDTISIVLAFGSGTLSWYQYSCEFVAVCRCLEHRCKSGCRKHRVSSARNGRPQQGRPLGYLAAWLSVDCSVFDSGKDHKDFVPTLSERQDARVALAAQGGDALRLLARERPRRVDVGEPDEPVVCP